MPKQYMVELAQDERDELEAVLKSSTRRAVSATKLQRARILLAVDQGVAGLALTDGQVVDALGVTERTCQHVRRRAVEQGPMKALERRPRPLPPVPKKLDGEKEARLVQVACSVPPEGRVRWTVKMLAEELVRLEVVETICGETVRQALKKRIETMAAGNVVHSEAAKPSFRGRHGAGAQGIPAAVRPAASGGVHGRDEQAARGGSPREVAGTPRVAGEVRRPLPPPGSMHGVDVRRAAVRLADSGCHQTAYDVGLGAASARAGESAALPGCGNHHAGVRQLEHPQR